jgi:hypothetical protein
MISALTFLSSLVWIDGKPLQLEPYRQSIFRRALDERRADGRPRYNMVVSGRAKKNFKTSDMVLAALFCLLCRTSPQGSDVLIVANDEDQAGDDLDLAKKIVRINGLADDDGELEILEKEIRRRDGKGSMQIIPARNATGQHGKSACFIGYDEIHGFRDWALMEALQPDPTRECLQWVTSYDTVHDTPGVPLYDLKAIGIAGSDERMLFSWYSADLCTDPEFVALPPEERANPSMSSWPEGRAYIDQQRRRLPSNRFRRLHLNLPGAPQGAFYDQATVERAIVARRQVLEPQDGIDYLAFVDMSGGSNDDATLAVAHWDGSKAILDLVINQDKPVPFNPRLAVARFATYCKRYRCKQVHGDAYAGETFRRDFADCGITYIVEKRNRTELYEALEVALNADQVELLEIPTLRRQLLTIVHRGASLDHMPGCHDDWATSASGALTLVNPDIGKFTPGMLEHYRRMAEAAAAQPAIPTLQQEHAGAPVMQIGSRPQRPVDYVKVLIPAECASSHILTASGASHQVELDGEGGHRVVWCSEQDALTMISFPLSLSWFELNADLRIRLQEKHRGGRPPPGQGMRWSDVMQASEDARPRAWNDRGGHVHDALRAVGRWPQ